MKRSPLLLALLVIAVVLTAGCMGLDGGDSATGDDDTTGTSDDADTDPDADDESDPPADDSADSSDEDGPGDTPDDSPTDTADWTVTDPEAPLHEAGSYTNTWTWRSSFEDADASGELTTTTRVDVEAARARTTTQVGDEVIEYFYADDKQYTRFGSAMDPVVMDAEFDEADLELNYGYAFDSDDLSEWTSQGVETYDGVTVQRYTYEGPDYWTELDQEPDASSFTPQETTFEMLVDADGIARYQSYRVDGVTETGAEGWYEWEYTLTDVGTTTVADPPWLEDATPYAY